MPSHLDELNSRTRLQRDTLAANLSRVLRDLSLVVAVLFHPPAVQAFTDEEVDAAADAAREVGIFNVIASDVYGGRNNDTPESLAVQAVLIDELKLLGSGLNTAQTGDDAYKQAFSSTVNGTNLLALIPGSGLPNEYVMIGAHYDHFGTIGSDIFNGATDDAAGVAIVLAVGAAINALPAPPQRSVILALWDAEEDGKVGSEHFANNPLVPLASIKSYVNLDISGQNLLPSLRKVTFVLGAESGGLFQQLALLLAAENSSLNVKSLSRLFGQDRSDHASFIDDGVPIFFFSDGTGSCYHTAEDDPSIVDVGKLAEQSVLAFRLLVLLTEASTPPVHVPTNLLDTVYLDAVLVLEVIDLAIDDLALFPPADQTTILDQRAIVQGVVDAGPGAFSFLDGLNVALAADSLLIALGNLPCDGFLARPVPSASAPVRATIIALLVGLGALFTRRIVRAV